VANFFQPVVDTTRVFLNSAMGGLPEMVGRNAERNRIETEAARERLGLVGDVANAAGFLAPAAGAVKAVQGLKYLPSLMKGAAGGVKSAAKALPAAERAVARKVVPGYAARENAMTRLATPYMAGPAVTSQMPTLTGAVGRAVAAHPGKAAIGAGVLGAGTAVSRNYRLYDEQNPPAARQAAAARPSPVARAQQVKDEPMSGDSTSFADRAIANYREMQAAQPNDFDGMIDQIAKAQGGQISLAQMGALAEMQNQTAPRGRQPQPGDAAGRMLEEAYVTQLQKAMQDPNADPVKAMEEFETKVLQLRKTQYIDPLGLGGQ
jgi:hypothetical protein